MFDRTTLLGQDQILQYNILSIAKIRLGKKISVIIFMMYHDRPSRNYQKLYALPSSAQKHIIKFIFKPIFLIRYVEESFLCLISPQSTDASANKTRASYRNLQQYLRILSKFRPINLCPFLRESI